MVLYSGLSSSVGSSGVAGGTVVRSINSLNRLCAAGESPILDAYSFQRSSISNGTSDRDIGNTLPSLNSIIGANKPDRSRSSS